MTQPEMKGIDQNVEKSPKPKANEVDFYRNPTILSRLILNQRYTSALRRLKNYPEEASVWVCSKRNPFKGKRVLTQTSSVTSTNSSLLLKRRTSSLYAIAKVHPEMLDYSLRQLPIHVACGNLVLAQDEHRETLERLITNLVVTYPEGCSQPDHEGRLPLHEAIWHNSSPETISMLLMASPQTLHERDKYGRSPTDLNRLRTGENKREIQDLLVRGTQFWESARSEAIKKLKATSGDGKEGGAGKPDQTSLTPVLENLAHEIKYHTETTTQGEVEASTWIKLERRALHLEQLLADLYEKNYEQGELIEELKQERVALQEEMDGLREANSVVMGKQDTSALVQEVLLLRERVSGLESQLGKPDVSMSANGSVNTEALHLLEDRNAKLQEEIDELTRNNLHAQDRLKHLEIVVASLSPSAESVASLSHLENGSVGSGRDSFIRLMDSLQSESVYATERFLAARVIDLEEQLAEVARSAASDRATAKEENARLLNENQVLHARVKALSSRRMHEIAPSELFHSDNLDKILNQAAAMYGDGPRSPSFRPLEDAETMPSPSFRRLKDKETMPSPSSRRLEDRETMPSPSSRRLKDKGTMPSPSSRRLEDKETMPSPSSRRLKGTMPPCSSRRVAEEEIRPTDVARRDPPGLQGETDGDNVPPIAYAHGMHTQSVVSELSMGTAKPYHPATDGPHRGSESAAEVPKEIMFALQSAIFSHPDGDVEKIMEETELAYGKPLSESVKSSIRRYTSMGEEPVLRQERQEQQDDDLDSILEEAQRLYGKGLSPELISAWKKASIVLTRGPSTMEPIPEMSEENPYPSERIPDDVVDALRAATFSDLDKDIEDILDTAEIAYGRCLPSDLKSYIRKVSITPEAQSHSDDDLDAVLQEAEKLYGKSLSPELIMAWRKISIGSSDMGSERLDSQYHAAFYDTARKVSHVRKDKGDPVRRSGRKRASARSRNKSDTFISELETDDLNVILSQAAREYSKPVLFKSRSTGHEGFEDTFGEVGPAEK